MYVFRRTREKRWNNIEKKKIFFFFLLQILGEHRTLSKNFTISISCFKIFRYPYFSLLKEATPVISSRDSQYYMFDKICKRWSFLDTNIIYIISLRNLSLCIYYNMLLLIFKQFIITLKRCTLYTRTCNV